MIQKENVTTEDIKRIAEVLEVPLNEEQTLKILNEYNRLVLDRGDSWYELVVILIVNEATKQFLKELDNGGNNNN